ncbi:MAG TPA: family 16 glycoside hydrolase [Terracidiphilus sp.]|nr:family 16 glycoside hydrolase [Terracidiphilus sp.]
MRGVCAALLALGVIAGTAAAQERPTRVTLDGNYTGRVFDGLGAASAGASSRLLIDYPEPQRSQILDYLFKPGYGAALQHLKVEIGADVNSTDGSEPSFMRTPTDHDATRGYEWWLMAEAHKRNPNILLEVLPWGAPRWVNPNPGKEDTVYTAKMAEYVADFIKTAKSAYGLDIGVTGVWNERPYDTAYVKELHNRLQAEHLSTKIICCDEYPGEGDGQWAIADEILRDPELAADVDVLGVHYPLVNGRLTTTDAARKTGKPLWSSEDQPNGGGGPFVTRDWPLGGRILAHLYNSNYLEGTFTATEIWSPITSYYDNLAAPSSGLMYANTPWSGHYVVQGAIWATAHTTQFVQPGWQYLDAASGYLPDKGSYVSLRSPDKKNWSVVLETIDATRPQKVEFKLTNGLTATKVHIWETNNTRTFERVADVAVKNGAFAYTFEPDSLYSLTTTTGQGKGTAVPPPAKPFPLPYSDDFESTRAGGTPKYLADQDGAFEVHPCDGRTGQCLEQVVTEKPVPWSPLPNPFTLAGSETWTDYRVSVDVHFLSQAPALVMGRIDTANVFTEDKALWPSGYLLELWPNGEWKLLSTAYHQPTATLAEGYARLGEAKWNRIALEFRGTTVTALLDGKTLAQVESEAHTRGMFALGTEWDHTQFDNLHVEP